MISKLCILLFVACLVSVLSVDASLVPKIEPQTNGKKRVPTLRLGQHEFRELMKRGLDESERRLDESLPSCITRLLDGTCRDSDSYIDECPTSLVERKNDAWCADEGIGEICCAADVRDCCKATSAGIAVFSIVVVVILFIVTLASCACCSCCPFYEKLCCARGCGCGGGTAPPSSSAAPAPEASIYNTNSVGESGTTGASGTSEAQVY